MAVLAQKNRLSKELSLFDVYALATGATLSSGLFLLPGLAARDVGPAVVVAYLLAAVPLIPAMLSMVELATAMPRAGGAYYFLDRSFGPLAGTIGGLGTWLALMLKTAFALVGMGAYLMIFFPEAPYKIIACGFALVFGVLNIFGSRGTGRVQVAFVLPLLLILIWFVARGASRSISRTSTASWRRRGTRASSPRPASSTSATSASRRSPASRRRSSAPTATCRSGCSWRS